MVQSKWLTVCVTVSPKKKTVCVTKYRAFEEENITGTYTSWLLVFFSLLLLEGSK
jgi:hypothetical protein